MTEMTGQCRNRVYLAHEIYDAVSLDVEEGGRREVADPLTAPRGS